MKDKNIDSRDPYKPVEEDLPLFDDSVDDGEFDGDHYDPELDKLRLQSQIGQIFAVLCKSMDVADGI